MPTAKKKTKRRRASEAHYRAGPHPLIAAQEMRCRAGAAADVAALPLRCYEPKACEEARAQMLALPSLVVSTLVT